MTVDGNIVSSIGRGVLVLAGIGQHDTTKDADTLANKIVKLRLWPDGDAVSVQTLSDK